MAPPAWRVEIKPAARRDLRRLPPDTQDRFLAALDGLTRTPPVGGVVKLRSGHDEYRLRRLPHGSSTTRRPLASR